MARKPPKRSAIGDAVQRAQESAEAELKELSDLDYVEACDDLESYFQSCAMAKRAELDKADDADEDDEP